MFTHNLLVIRPELAIGLQTKPILMGCLRLLISQPIIIQSTFLMHLESKGLLWAIQTGLSVTRQGLREPIMFWIMEQREMESPMTRWRYRLLSPPPETSLRRAVATTLTGLPFICRQGFIKLPLR